MREKGVVFVDRKERTETCGEKRRGKVLLFSEGTAKRRREEAIRREKEAQAAEYDEARRAARAGSTEGMRRLARCYEEGWGVAEDEAKAFAGYRKAADMGDVEALNCLVWRYMGDDDDPAGEEEAFSCARRAAEAGSVPGMMNLALCYEFGCGVPEDDGQAFAWYKKAAELGDMLAMREIGERLAREGKQEEAQVWLDKADASETERQP